MKIYSSFSDYYDIGLAYGHDPNIVYERETRTDHVDKLPHYGRNAHVGDGALLFCGKAYPYIKLYKGDSFVRCWSTDDYANHLSKKDREIFNAKGHEKYALVRKYNTNSPTRWRYAYSLDRNRMDEFFDNIPSDSVIMQAHLDYQSPIIMLDRYKGDRKYRDSLRIIVNPRLEPTRFASVVDPYTAFQELDMFMSNVFGTKGVEPRPISDELKRDMHGFDDMSFKQYKPGDKKRRRKENRARKKGGS